MTFTKYIPVGWIDHLMDEATREVFQEGTPINRVNLEHMEDGIMRALDGLIYLLARLHALEAELKILKDATLNNMTNNVFFEDFATLEEVTISSGVYDPMAHKIYV